MRVRYQRGYLRLGQRKKGPDRWEFLWWDSDPTGERVRRKAIIGTVQQYPNLENAWQASNGLRVSINETRNRQREQTITVADLVDHYIATELASAQVDGGKSHATKTVYRDILTRWVKPKWGSLNIRDVRTIAVEQWLGRLLRVDGRTLANSTKAKIRNLMSVLYNHAIRYEWLEQGKNPILLVRQSAKRQRIPDWLEAEELSALLSQLDRCFRVMVFLDAATGLRRSELLAPEVGRRGVRQPANHSSALNLWERCGQLQNRGLEETRANGSNSGRRTLGLEATQFLQSAVRLGVCKPPYQGQEPLLAR